MTAQVIQLPGQSFEPTEIGNADLFKHLHGQHARYVVGIGWMLYDGPRWQQDTSNQVLTVAKQAIKEINDLEWRHKSQTRGKLKAMVAGTQRVREEL